MPLLEIATTQALFQNDVVRFSSHTTKFKFSSSSWKSFRIPPHKSQDLGGIKLCWGGLMIRSVATLEKKQPTKSKSISKSKQGNEEEEQKGDSSSSTRMGSNSSEELDEREKLRRMRISKANKGNKPWNLGRKHSAETLRRIKERTRLAMQDPKVKMKLVNLGHAQSEETKIKIGFAVRIGWEKRREKLMLQESCYFEWQDLVVEASRKGLLGEEELQWDSYQILSEQLEQEWIQSVEERKKMARQKGNKRGPKSPEQRRKISEAIAAKWADPAYRIRVCSSMAKYHGIPEGLDRKPRRKPSSDGQTRKRSPPTKKVNGMDDSVKPDRRTQIQRVRLKRKSTPMYKDPLASSKLEMLKSIRAQRAGIDQKKSEAITRAKALIAEAEKAAEALEIAAKNSSIAQVSLIETRKLISEAIESIVLLEKEEGFSDANVSSVATEPVNQIEEKTNEKIEVLNGAGKTIINGSHAEVPTGSGVHNLEYDNDNHILHGSLNGKSMDFLSSVGEYDILGNRQEVYQMIYRGISPPEGDNMTQHASPTQRLGAEANGNQEDEANPLPNGLISEYDNEETPSQSATITTKKWVCGRLVEVGEGS